MTGESEAAYKEVIRQAIDEVEKKVKAEYSLKLLICEEEKKKLQDLTISLRTELQEWQTKYRVLEELHTKKHTNEDENRNRTTFDSSDKSNYQVSSAISINSDNAYSDVDVKKTKNIRNLISSDSSSTSEQCEDSLELEEVEEEDESSSSNSDELNDRNSIKSCDYHPIITEHCYFASKVSMSLKKSKLFRSQERTMEEKRRIVFDDDLLDHEDQMYLGEQLIEMQSKVSMTNDLPWKRRLTFVECARPEETDFVDVFSVEEGCSRAKPYKKMPQTSLY